MNVPAPTLSIIIVNWRSKDFVRDCLFSIRETCAGLSLEIVVVDGASFDGCAEMLASEFPEVQFVQSHENIGFGQCNNLGFSHTSGDFILLLNPDTELQPAALQLLLSEIQSRPGAALVAPKLLNSDGSLQTSCVQALPTPLNQALDSEFLRKIFPNSKLWGVGEAFASTEPVVVQAVSGACMLIRREIYDQLGGFSPEYFMYGEDMDLCYRIRRMDLDIVHVPAAIVMHHGSGSSTKQVNHFSTVLIRSTQYTYMRSNHGQMSASLYRILQMGVAMIRLLIVAPAWISINPRHREAARRTSGKWTHILKWCLGITPLEQFMGRVPKSDSLPGSLPS